MGLRGNRGPYAPQRKQPPMVDYAAMQRESDRVRAEIARVDQEARDRRVQEQVMMDPMAQLVGRCYELELRQDAFDTRLGRVEEQLRTIIDLLKAGKDG